MKKFISLALILILSTISFQGFIFINNENFVDRVFKKTNIKFNFINNENEAFDLEEFTRKLFEFSKRNEVNISQYEFVDDAILNIYSTKREIEWKPVNKGVLDQETYLTNHTRNKSNQAVRMYFPITNMDINIYDFSKVKNVGLGNELYINSTDSLVINKFKNEFSMYGIEGISAVNINNLLLVNKYFINGVIFCFLITVLFIFIYLFMHNKEIILMNFWGYSLLKMTSSFLKKFFGILGITFSIVITIMILIISKSAGINQVPYYLLRFVFIYLTILLFMFMLIMLFTKVILFYSRNVEGTKGKKAFLYSKWIVIVLKVGIYFLFLSTIVTAYYNGERLKSKTDEGSYWNKMEDIYRIQYSQLDESVDSNLKADNDLNSRLEKFYQLLDNKKGAFLIDARNYYLLKYENNLPKYAYEVNADAFYMRNGKRITINENYLKYNPIMDADGKDVINSVYHDDKVLNILVPIQYKNYENQIIEEYINEFYFQKVEVDNIYNRELGFLENETKKNELSINLIYVKSNQTYFSYNALLGDDKNFIKDPIVVIYTGGMNKSYIAALVTSSLYFENHSEGRAYESIEELIAQANVPEIRQVRSIYSESNNQLVSLKYETVQYYLNSMLLLLFLMFVLILYMWLYYSLNTVTIGIKSVLGYSTFKLFLDALILNVLLEIMVGLIIYFTCGQLPFVFIVVVVILSFEIILSQIIIRRFSNKSIGTILKGRML
ncbi:hypothetical protein [Faecalicatena contorta]|uniref:Bacteriocin-associated integral membrane (Putative immunity) protein n=1 Tax=Faecalicatena contorta TaxID=39482 RepID=A0A315ZQW9_9FIRM|nr:hypothetical protein [Faecalicatena contorta]PWJ47971.1 bacteriocin-associated integral membrane protein [Faecalicatena contorta]SUQ15734.1 bacteriocin-associated integral membrane (putative immunity) protein [Faecalicatena contorta]